MSPTLPLLILTSGLSIASSYAAPPNVVILLADDAGWGDYGHTGNTMAHTPNIDTLARDGARFDRFYVCSVCSPTRAEFLTGRYHTRGGVRGVSLGQERLNLDERTIAEAFHAAGYATGAFGKWHNGSQWPYHPMARGFDEYFGFTSGHWGEYFDPPLEHNGQVVREKGYIADLFTNHAIEFIERNAMAGKPFFCYLPFNTPHSPWAAPEENWEHYRDNPIPQRGTAGDQETVDETRCVHAMLENQDHNVGRVLQRLSELKLQDNTIVFYFSDNGPNTVRWNGGMKGKKGTVDEGGLRSTALIRWPGKIAPGTTIREIAGAIDLLPTFTSLCGIARVGDKPLDGLDLSPLLFGKTEGWPDRIIFTEQGGKVSARSQQYRVDADGALYDMIADPGQTKAIADPGTGLPEKWAEWKATVGKLPKLDDRPIPVGYSEFPWTPLPARDGTAEGAIKRSGRAPNCSYFVNWRTLQDAMVWDVDIHTAGNYAVTLYYTCPLADAGSTVELSLGDARLTGTIAPGWDPPLYTNQDTVPRNDQESRMKEFRPLNWGTIHLEKGRGQLRLRATTIPGQSVADVRLLTLSLQP
jgi:arylsulfatase A-like enzyme